jgi:catechol 2,3-dioxygenase-like lactoylglutathione lyase family enzyme
MESTLVRWAGLNHLALITNDLETTTRFWHGVLGAPLVATIGTETFRHYFFDVGHGATVAFFEYRGYPVQRFAKPAGVPDKRAVQFDHVALNLPDEAALLALRQRLLEHGCEVTEVVDHGLMQSIYFTDPNGIALEASWWADNPTGRAPAPSDARYSDPNPVPAVRELLATKHLGTLPATRLVNEPTGDMYRVVCDQR